MSLVVLLCIIHILDIGRCTWFGSWVCPLNLAANIFLLQSMKKMEASLLEKSSALKHVELQLSTTTIQLETKSAYMEGLLEDNREVRFWQLKLPLMSTLHHKESKNHYCPCSSCDALSPLFTTHVNFMCRRRRDSMMQGGRPCSLKVQWRTWKGECLKDKVNTYFKSICRAVDKKEISGMLHLGGVKRKNLSKNILATWSKFFTPLSTALICWCVCNLDWFVHRGSVLVGK